MSGGKNGPNGITFTSSAVIRVAAASPSFEMTKLANLGNFRAAET